MKDGGSPDAGQESQDRLGASVKHKAACPSRQDPPPQAPLPFRSCAPAYTATAPGSRYRGGRGGGALPPRQLRGVLQT